MNQTQKFASLQKLLKLTRLPRSLPQGRMRVIVAGEEDSPVSQVALLEVFQVNSFGDS